MNQDQIRRNYKSLLSLAKNIGGTKAGQKLAQKWQGKVFLALGGVAVMASPTYAMKINATYSSEVSLETTQVIEEIAAVWEEELKDPITLNLNFSFSDSLPTGILGGSKPAMTKVKYKDYLTALGQDSLSSQDVLAIKNKLVNTEDLDLFNKYLADEIERKKFKVKETKTLDVLIDETFVPESGSGNGNGVLDNNGNGNNQKIWLTRGNAKALGFIKGDDKRLDGSIVLSNTVNWDMNPDDGIDADAYDFRTVILHEIGHALGFVSGADAIEFLTMSSTATIEDNDLTYITPMNTYTYSNESAALGVMDLRLGQGIEKYISLDGGVTKLTNEQGDIALLSTGGVNVGGDGYQTSHWKDSTLPLGIMNPSLNQGETIPISELDLTLLDVMGWDMVNRTKELMDETGLNWDGFQEVLEVHKDAVVQFNDNLWISHNPDDTIAPELKEKLEELYKDIELDIREQLLKLKEDLANEDDPIKQDERRVYRMGKIWDLIEHQDDELEKFANDMKDVNVRVRDWLDQDINQLGNLLRDANQVQIHKLQRVIARGTPEEQLMWEDKLTQALALFLENPDTALAQITKTNDFHSPIGWGGSSWWGGWWASSDDDDDDDDDLYYHNRTTLPESSTSTESAQSVPEPSSLIGLMVLGGLAAWNRHRKP